MGGGGLVLNGKRAVFHTQSRSQRQERHLRIWLCVVIGAQAAHESRICADIHKARMDSQHWPGVSAIRAGLVVCPPCKAAGPMF